MSGLPVEIRALTVRHGAVPALRGVDLTVAAGEFVAIVGHSGAGKTTLLRCVCGLPAEREGQVTVGGHAMTSPLEALARGVVHIPQGNGLARVLTALENVLVGLRAAGLTRDLERRALGALTSVGLGDSPMHLVEELSGGQQQRVAVARALAMPSTVLVADEPTSELDHASRAAVLELLRERTTQGVTVLMATHDVQAAARADRVVHLDDGVLVCEPGERHLTSQGTAR